MNRNSFVQMMRRDFDTIVSINEVKGHDYAGDTDALANFKLQAAECGITPEQVWSVLAGKHWSAVRTYAREGDVQSEPIEGRIYDLILYSFLLLGMVREREDLPEREDLAVCGRIMVGRGTDTYDPVCELDEGHAGACKSGTIATAPPLLEKVSIASIGPVSLDQAEQG